ncbi:MAG: SURF1 family protein [Steroidobacteraceae bacterium]
MPAAFRCRSARLLLRMELGKRVFEASVWMATLALAAVLLFAQLGRWQWHRAAEKRALAAEFEAGVAAGATGLGERALTAVPRYAQLRVRGHYDGARQFLLDNISRDGAVGYEVLTPFVLEDGRILVVNRGWLPLPGGRRDRLPDVTIPPPATSAPALAEITGRLDKLPVAALAIGRAPPDAGPSWPKRTSFPSAAQLGAALKAPIEDGQLLLSAAEPMGYRRDWPLSANGFAPSRHVAYALQWWSFGALALFLFLFLNIERRQS